MNLLLDTHVLLWWLDGGKKIAAPVRKMIGDGDNAIWVSAVSAWEIVLKESIGKIKTPGNLSKELERQAFLLLNLNFDHAEQVRGLPFHHRDPFDRMLIAQALHEKLTLVTRDRVFWHYGVEVVEA
jgi:PIN domain nuclease of toxin-antitoxin system